MLIGEHDEGPGIIFKHPMVRNESFRGGFTDCFGGEMADHVVGSPTLTDRTFKEDRNPTSQIVPDATTEMSVILQPGSPPHRPSQPQEPVHHRLLPGPCGE